MYKRGGKTKPSQRLQKRKIGTSSLLCMTMEDGKEFQRRGIEVAIEASLFTH